MKKILFLFVIILLANFTSFSQSVLISDDASYTSPNGSAAFEVYSKSGGLLIPRMLTSERTAIATPADGLIIYDTDLNSYFIRANSNWQLMQEGFWKYNSTLNSVYLADNKTKVGIGTNTPDGKFEIVADNTLSKDKPLFEVKNTDGQTVFAVYNKGVRIFIDDDEGSKAGSPGGFAIKGLTGAKANKNYFWVTRDSTRVYIEPTVASGSPGGFAVKGLTGVKGSDEDYLQVTRDSTRVYVNTSGSKAGSPGGFAIKGLTGAKGANDTRFLHLVPDNYFIGHQSGIKINNGLYNTIFGYQAGKGLTESNRNVLIGYQSGTNITTGSDNILVGYQTGLLTTEAGNVIAIGSGAGYSNTNNSDNIFIGRDAGFYHTGTGTANEASNNIYIGLESGAGYSTSHNQGENNIFMGVRAGKSNTIGRNNILLGLDAGGGIKGGSQNISIGNSSGGNLSNSSNNVFIGNETAGAHQNGDGNIAMGVDAFAQNDDGADNIIVGTYAGFGDVTFTQTANRNVVMGKKAGYYLNGAEDNVFIGNEAAYGTYSSTVAGISGDFNVIIGEEAGKSLTSGEKNVFLGHKSGFSITSGTNNLFMGFEAGYSNNTGANNTFIGYYSGRANTTGNLNLFLGYKTGQANTDGENNLFIGTNAGAFNVSSGNNTFIGHHAGFTNNGGENNMFIGPSAGFSNTTGNFNHFIGKNAGYDNTVGHDNLFIGDEAGRNNTTGNYNMFIGSQAGNGNQTGSNNIAIGYLSANMLDAATENILIGNNVGPSMTSGNSNVIIGTAAGNALISGERNIMIGAGAGSVNASGTDNVFIGYNAGKNEAGSGKLYIDCSLTPEPLIGGDFIARTVQLNGDLTFNPPANSVTLPSTRGSAGQVLATNGSGNTSWTDVSLSTTASNGLYKSGDDIRQGGSLIENTTIYQGDYSMLYDLTGTGAFEIQDNGTSAFYVKNDGTIGIGTNTPATNTIMHILESGTPLASQFVGTVACFQQNENAGDWARISIIGGNSGASIVDFGDANLQNAGHIRYGHSDNSMFFQTDGAERISINNTGDLNLSSGTNGGEINRTQTGAANLVPIAYGNIASNGTINTSTGNITMSSHSTGVYEIEISGENYYYTDYITNVTIVSGNYIANASSTNNHLYITIKDLSGTLTDAIFSFIVYKP